MERWYGNNRQKLVFVQIKIAILLYQNIITLSFHLLIVLG